MSDNQNSGPPTDPFDQSKADNLGSVERVSLSSQAYQHIRKALMRGALKPGQRLSVRELSTRLGAGLTPVREALLQLVGEGVLESRAGHSITVPTLSSADYLELRDIRIEIEGLGAARAAVAMSTADVARLEDVQAKLMIAKAERRFDDALRLNETFHLELARGAQMPRLLRVFESLWAQSGPFLNFLYGEDAAVAGASRHGHELVIEALKAGDADAAAKAIATDIMNGSDDLLRRLAK